MNKVALTLPGGNTIPAPSGLNPEFVDLASFLSPLLNIVFYIAVFLAFYFLVWGAFQYILAGGKKEELAKAGVTSEKAIAMAVSVNEEGFETMLATFSEVAVAEQKKVIESKKVDIQKGQEELATIVANTGGASEMDLSEKMSFSEKFRTVSKKAIDKISK